MVTTTVRTATAAVASLVLVMDDPDAVEPAGKVWLHWLVWNVVSPRTEIPEGWEPESAVEGVTDFEERGYGGPLVLVMDDPDAVEHTYRLKLYALGSTLDVPDSASKREVGSAMQGDVLAATQLEGTFAP
ncbi:MAG: YbhB/YbcL family Raf kinase inhibitor-like protein [Halobacteriales archaeon SW_9_67_25]|nr:MAG: YbhB/YbcL family Raf kinase inhibitor-like protein [Halobacteriales archaeon SW_9_67_25]